MDFLFLFSSSSILSYLKFWNFCVVDFYCMILGVNMSWGLNLLYKNSVMKVPC